jgi:hypothetical protein
MLRAERGPYGTLACFGYQRGKEFLGHALYHTCDQRRSKLRVLSADLGL